ncbi:sensor histidine kinase [Cytophaga hutchinsonii]|uniref:histidine kinase n=1 Tax=Cytophaga hutchinsonii (strain ATCC 33406 / DSM 1761 / CIP 103989 / NBRC 15051 / NCIMB 9469 / D465) TaxID=269798 RepID=A0A6N4SVV4_CYTH3|nr:sensor histidine kinase [Cytophaga hutchinsonii]ABG60702.1 sensor histidine kinase [Cytophaga hutchinsonii ATCC 33406]SFX69964.1 hypothetical protein SAMN04487930_10827 [Cytophaga hutchinsonii ATCC 33406]
MKKGVIFILLGLYCAIVHAQTRPLILNDTAEKFEWRKGNYAIYRDTVRNLPLSRILELQREGIFKKTTSDAPRLQSSRQDMWAKVIVYNGSLNQTEWLIELYDFHIDEYDIYILQKDSLYAHFTGGDLQPFHKRKIEHKNFIHEIVFEPHQLYTLFIRIHSRQSVAVNGVVRTFPSFLEYSNREYLFLAIFYGVILLMAVYCVCIYVFTKEKTYIYFAANVLSVALYSLTNDGLGFQYIWPNHINFNAEAQSLAIALFSTTALMYTTAFLNVKIESTKYCLVIRVTAAVRFLLFLIGLLFYRPLLYFYQLDLLILIFIFYTSIVFYKKDFKAARFFILAYTALFIGFSLNLSIVLGVGFIHPVTVYGLNIGIVIQLFLFSFALADRIRLANKDNRNTQLQIIHQLKENEILKDKLTKELEDKVKERTQELEFKNQQLDAFVYKASHDIKGPLKSIIGLAKLGLLDVQDPNAREYFKHIETSSTRLDNLLQDLLQVAKIKNTVIESTVIDFKKIIDTIKDGFSNIESFGEFYIDVQIKQDRDFYSDEKMVYSIFQNLIENAFTYRDIKKQKSSLYIRIEVDKQKSVIEFTDNGIGINKDLKDKVFDMFFRASEISGGTGLGLYLVKMAVNKIGGRIQVNTEVSKGTTFTVVI